MNKYYVKDEYDGHTVTLKKPTGFEQHKLSITMRDRDIMKLAKDGVPTFYFGETETGKKVPLADVVAGERANKKRVSEAKRVAFELPELTPRKGFSIPQAAQVDDEARAAKLFMQLITVGKVTAKTAEAIKNAENADELSALKLDKAAAFLQVDNTAQAVFEAAQKWQ